MPYVENQTDANSTQELAVFHDFLRSSHTELALFILHRQVFTRHPCWCLMLTSAGAFIKYICLYIDTFYRIGLLATQGNCSFREVQVVPQYNSFPEKIKKSLNLAAWLLCLEEAGSISYSIWQKKTKTRLGFNEKQSVTKYKSILQERNISE